MRTSPTLKCLGANLVIAIDGKTYPTIVDAAKHWKVSAKTVREWRKRGVITSKPPRVSFGLRKIDVYSAEYLARATKEIEQFRRLKGDD